MLIDSNYNIGIKHGFLCINICWALREMLKSERNPSLKGEGFNLSRAAQQMLMHQKNVFDRFYYIG